VTPVVPELSLLERAQDYQALLDRTEDIVPSGRAAMNDAPNSARFEGGAAIGVNASFNGGGLTGDAILIGDATVNVNFNNGSVSGGVTNVFGLDRFDNIDEYSGSLALSGGAISGNDLEADYSGTLRGNGDTIVMGGTLDGEFLGNPGIRALEIGDDGSGRFNGSRAETVIVIDAEIQ